jgi:DNA-binding NtrC family response regulator
VSAYEPESGDERDAGGQLDETTKLLKGNGSALPRPDKLVLEVISGPDAGRAVELDVGTYVVGKAPGCELSLSDGAVSRKHLAVALVEGGVQVRDLGSKNGSFFEGARFDSIRVGPGAVITVGQTELRVSAPAATGASTSALPLSEADSFGELMGGSVAMRQMFTVIARAAASESVVLVQGETGTGKELVAEAIHQASPRAKGPFVVCDLGSLPRSLIESELFGHVRGAFTGADRDRQGALASAHGGTLFLDEIGELELDVQPRLLRALERRQFKPVGSSRYRTSDARVVVATNRDLLAEARAGRFREDLYHRLAVVRVHVPPLRERREDIPRLVLHFLAAAAAPRQPSLVPPETMTALRSHDWPGNVRELRNVLDRATSLAPDAHVLDARLLGLDEPGPARSDASTPPVVDVNLPFKESKDRLVQAWEREYVTALLDKAGGNVSLAARSGGLDRVYLHRLMKKHGLGA